MIYEILKADCPEELAVQVRQAIARGMKTVGGPLFVGSTETWVEWYQAVAEPSASEVLIVRLLEEYYRAPVPK